MMKMPPCGDQLVSALNSIAGIGPARRRALLRRFGSVEGVRRATLEEKLSLPGMTRPVAERLQAALGDDDSIGC